MVINIADVVSLRVIPSFFSHHVPRCVVRCRLYQQLLDNFYQLTWTYNAKFRKASCMYHFVDFKLGGLTMVACKKCRYLSSARRELCEIALSTYEKSHMNIG